MQTLVECTLPEKILLVAAHLEGQGQTSFTAENLIVAAWQRYPQTFGLRGYEQQYPDSNRVLAHIMGEKGLPRRGWMAKVAQKLYALTDDGRQIVQKLQQGEDTPPLTAKRTAPRLSREQDLFLQALLAASAFRKQKLGRQVEWTFSEACRFWTLADRKGDAVDERLEEIETQLRQIHRVHGEMQVLGNGQEVTLGEVEMLIEVHLQMQEKFARHLGLLRNRG